jgi:hypothetical protein
MSDASPAVKSTPGSSLNASTAPSAVPTNIPGMPKLELPSHRPGGGHHGITGTTGSPQRLQPPLSPHHRSTVVHPRTGLGSPIHSTRIRSHSIGNHPYPLGIPPLPTMSPYSAQSLPVSPLGAPLQTKVGGPDMPFLLSSQVPPEHSETHKAMEAAATRERARSKQLEEEEMELDAGALRGVLKRERARMGRIAADLAAMKSTAVQAQLEAEVIEEGRINCLMRRLDTVQQEKGRIIVELEMEEEMVSWLDRRVYGERVYPSSTYLVPKARTHNNVCSL